MKNQTIWKVSIPVIIGVIIFAMLSINFQENFMQNESATQSKSVIPKAAIIDQLDTDKPNENFQKMTTKYLQVAGYEVDLYTTDEITINFYKRLPALNYEFIVIRSHALGEGGVEESESLFTGEKYSEEKHIEDQILGLVGKAVPFTPTQVESVGVEALINQTYFVVGSRLVDEKMIGNFPDSTIILGGCDTVEGKVLADSLLNRGASEIIGWDGLVTAPDNDEIILAVLNQTLVHDVDIDDAIKGVMKDYKPKMRPSATLEYYSSDSIESKG